MHILMDNSVWMAYFEACLHNQYRTKTNLATPHNHSKSQHKLTNQELTIQLQPTHVEPAIKAIETAAPASTTLSTAGLPQPTGEMSLINAHHSDEHLLLMETVEFLTNEKMLVTNDVVLAELTPYLQSRFVYAATENPPADITEISDVLGFTTPFSFDSEHTPQIMKVPLAIDWEEIARFHSQCAQAKMNNVNLTDLLVTQSALQNQLRVFSFKPQFHSLHELLGVDIMQYGCTERT